MGKQAKLSQPPNPAAFSPITGKTGLYGSQDSLARCFIFIFPKANSKFRYI